MNHEGFPARFLKVFVARLPLNKGNRAIIVYNVLVAGAASNLFPLMSLFITLQRYYTKGISIPGLAGQYNPS